MWNARVVRLGAGQTVLIEAVPHSPGVKGRVIFDKNLSLAPADAEALIAALQWARIAIEEPAPR
jgi:hypothetical protein